MTENQNALSTVVTVLSSIQEEVRRISLAVHRGRAPLQLLAPTAALDQSTSAGGRRRPSLTRRRRQSTASATAIEDQVTSRLIGSHPLQSMQHQQQQQHVSAAATTALRSFADPLQCVVENAWLSQSPRSGVGVRQNSSSSQPTPVSTCVYIGPNETVGAAFV